MSAFGRTPTLRPRGKGKPVWEGKRIRKVKREVSTTSLHQWPMFRPPFKTCYSQIHPARLNLADAVALSLTPVSPLPPASRPSMNRLDYNSLALSPGSQTSSNSASSSASPRLRVKSPSLDLALTHPLVQPPPKFPCSMNGDVTATRQTSQLAIRALRSIRYSPRRNLRLPGLEY